MAKGIYYNYFADQDALAREVAAQVRVRMENEIARANLAVEDPATPMARALCCVIPFGLLSPNGTNPLAALNVSTATSRQAWHAAASWRHPRMPR